MPLIRSWVDSANAADCPFPLNNLPYGVFSVGGDAPRCGAAIGRCIVDLAAAEARGLLDAWEDAGRPAALPDARFPRTAARLALMWERFLAEGFTSFWL